MRHYPIIGLPAGSALAIEYQSKKVFYARLTLRQQFLMQRSGVPQLIRSGHANRIAASSGEDDLACPSRMFPTIQNKPHIAMVTKVPANAQWSTLAAKGPALT